jgi:hypothetical protein
VSSKRETPTVNRTSASTTTMQVTGSIRAGARGYFDSES